MIYNVLNICWYVYVYIYILYIYKYIYNRYMYSIRKCVYHALQCIYILHLQVVSQRLIDRDPEEDSGAGGPPFGLVEEPMDF